MKAYLPLAAAVMLALPAQAQNADDTLKNLFDDFRKQLEQFSDEVGPMMEGFSKEVSPLLEGLAEQLKDLNAYHAPEILPNGDILIRRKSPKEMEPQVTPETDEAIDI